MRRSHSNYRSLIPEDEDPKPAAVMWSSVKPGSNSRSGGLSDDLSDNPVKRFRWGGSVCTGNSLHQAVIRGDAVAVKSILKKGESSVRSQFRYEGGGHEGRGEAIHIAVSRGNLPMTKLLFEEKASLDAMVTHDDYMHSNILHTAVSAEGRGGSASMVRFLLERKAEMAENLAGEWPLHKAFQTGSLQLIPLLRAARTATGLAPIEGPEESDVSAWTGVTPLMCGMQSGRLTVQELARAALPNPFSLALFMHREPRCIPEFLKRLREEGKVDASRLAAHVTVRDLASVLRDYPTAADDLLMAMATAPVIESEGWNPLPTRMNFAPRTLGDKLLALFNPPRLEYAAYVPDLKWKFDVGSFRAPAWQENLRWSEDATSRNAMARDVVIKVCHMRGIVCPEFLAALKYCEADSPIFDNPVVHGVLNMVWWSGACRQDVMQLSVTIWALILLVYDSLQPVRAHQTSAIISSAHQERRLMAGRGGSAISRGGDGRKITEGILDYSMFEESVSSYFIGARGFVDFVHELVQFIGTIRIGRHKEYCTPGNALDLARCVLPVLWLMYPRNRLLRVYVILTYWARTLEINFSQSLANELLPIVRLARGLVPVSAVAVIGFCAMTHTFHALEPLGTSVWPNTFFKSFSLLVTAALPEVPGMDPVSLVFSYLAVIAFTVFFLNIFIGVISENYAYEKSVSRRTFQDVRTSLCLAYSLRAGIISFLVPTCFAQGLIALVVVLTLALQICLYFGFIIVPSWMVLVAFGSCQAVILACSYQTSVVAKWNSGGDDDKAYLWLVLAKQQQG